MRVLQFMPEFGLAGAERMVEDLSLGLRYEGIEVSCVSLYEYHSSITDSLEGNDIRIAYLGKRRGPDVSMYPKIRKLVRAEQPDVIHTHRYSMKYVMPAIAGMGVHAVHTVHSMASEEVPKHQIGFQRLVFHSGRSIPVAISPQVKRSICDLYGLDANRVPLIYNGVDRNVPQGGRAHREFTFLHIGRYETVKNHVLLIEAFEEVHRLHPNTRLKLVGQGSLFDDVARIISERGLREAVLQVGSVDDVGPFLAGADAFVLASKYEGFPISIIEAFCAGLPCICTAVGGVPDVVEDGVNGLLCECDRQSLATSMSMVVKDGALRLQLGEGALEASRKYSRSNMTKEYISLYEKVLSDEKV